MKRILFVVNDYWARLQLDHSQSWRERFEVIYASPSNEECEWDFDAVAYIDEAAKCYKGAIDGVTSSSDYPGAQLAAGISRKLGLPGSPLNASLTCAHKYYARVTGKAVVPEATPPFETFEINKPREQGPAHGFPCFIKPVKASFSVQARRLHSLAELNNYLTQPFLVDYGKRYLHTFNGMIRGCTDFEFDGNYALCEGLLQGEQITIEGWVHNGEVGIIGITDSIMHHGTNSFARFEYPSNLPQAVQARMADIATRVIRKVGLDYTLWNIELFYDRVTEKIAIIEINPRMASQFADLYEKVDGLNGFEMALMLAAGEKPKIKHGSGKFKFAASVPLRVFKETRVLKIPTANRIREVEAAHPESIIWWECNEGELLSPKEDFEDGISRRYGVINLGAQTREELPTLAMELEKELGANLHAAASATPTPV